MTHVVCEPCNDCKYTDCVLVCPVDCFYQDEMQLWIHPDECIDCEACVPECPVEAIFAEGSVPDEWNNFTGLNAEKAVALKSAGGNLKTRLKAQEGPDCIGVTKLGKVRTVNEPTPTP